MLALMQTCMLECNIVRPVKGWQTRALHRGGYCPGMQQNLTDGETPLAVPASAAALGPARVNMLHSEHDTSTHVTCMNFKFPVN